MLDEKKMSNFKLKRLNKKRKIYQEKYGLDYDEFLQKQEEKKQKNKYGFKNIKTILNICKKDTKYLWLSFLFLLLGTITSIAGTYMYVYVIDDITLEFYTKAFYTLFIYAACIISSQVLWFFFNRYYHKASNSISYTVKKSLFVNVLQVHTKKYNEVSSGEIINRVTSDSSKFAKVVTDLVYEIGAFIESASYVVVCFVLNIYLGAVVLVLGLVAYLIRRIYIHKRAAMYSSRSSYIGDLNTSVIQEAIRGNKDIKNLNLKSVINDKQTALAVNYKNSSLDDSLERNFFNRASWGLVSISKILILLVAIYLIKNGYSSLGIVIGILSFMWEGLSAFISLGNVTTNMKEATVYSGRMLEILDDEKYPKEKFGDVTIDNMKGEVEFKNVTFGYEKDKTLFKNLSFKIEAGQSIGIVGKSGQGKSSIINLINKLFEVNKGKIYIDGIDINTLTEDCIRNNISVVSQSPYIFDLTLKENLKLVNEKATMEDIISACKQAYIHDYIMTLDKGYDSKIGEGGVQLSGGQKQRLAIARALLRDTKILLLDEATSALDNESQEKIKCAINKFKKDKTVIIVAHRLTTVIDCDRILFIDDNKIKADGKHSVLMKTCPEYKQLYNTEDSIGSEE